MNEPITFKAKGNGIEMHIAQWGDNEKPLVCVHGMTANCRCWDRLVPVLTENHRVLGIDLRGRGLSDKPDTGYSLEHHVRDIYTLLEDQGLERVSLMGHSLGAYISVVFAATYPDKVYQLILLDGGGQLTRKRWDNIEQVIKPSLGRLEQVFPSLDAYTAPLKTVPFFQPWTEFHDIYFKHDTRQTDTGVRSRINPEHIRSEISDIRKKDFATHYPDIACDVLILKATEGIIGQGDLLLPEKVTEKMLNKISDSKTVDIQGTNHFSILFDQHRVRDKALAAFLANR